MILFYVLIWVMPLAQHPIWSRFVGQLTVIKYLGAACLLYACFHVSARRKVPPYFQTWQARLFLLFFVLAGISYWKKGPAFSLEMNPFVSYASFLLLFFITLTVVDSLRRLRGALLAAIGSVAFASLYVLREWQKGHNVYADFRPGWVVGDSNYFAASALFSLSLAFYLMQERRPRWERLFCVGCLVLTLLAVTLCASRGGFLGLIAAFLFIVWRSRQRVRNVALAGALLLPLSLALPVSPVHRLLHPNYGDEVSQQNHLLAWKAGLRMIQAHPLAGVGLGNFKPLMPSYLDPEDKVGTMAHNVYVEIAAEMGLPGLLVFLLILYLSYKTLERVRRQTLRSGPALLYQSAIGIEAGLAGYSVASFFLSTEYEKLFWLMLFLSMCLFSLTRSETRNEKAAPAAFRRKAART